MAPGSRADCPPVVEKSMAISPLTASALVLLSAWSAVGAQPEPRQTPVFQAGEAGYHTFRIPALVATRRGTVLAFAEGRKNSAGDSGDIDLTLKRSFDNGKTWQKLQVVADHGADTIGNPCPVVDRTTGVIWLLLTGNGGDTEERKILAGTGTRSVWITGSKDDGATWSPAVEITSSVKSADWTWYATGPGNGIQLRSGELVVPACHARRGTTTFASHVIYSRDHGRTWQLGGSASDDTDESAVVELGDGSLMLNMRSAPAAKKRSIARSRDKGLIWSPVTLDETLIEPTCEASLIRFEGKGRAKAALLFSNPADRVRARETVRLSYDDGLTWPASRLLYEGPSAYSSLAVLRDGSIGCLYERGKTNPYETITFAGFPMEWLTTPGR